LSKETLEQVKRPEELLRRKAVLGSTEILTPTCFLSFFRTNSAAAGMRLKMTKATTLLYFEICCVLKIRRFPL